MILRTRSCLPKVRAAPMILGGGCWSTAFTMGTTRAHMADRASCAKVPPSLPAQPQGGCLASGCSRVSGRATLRSYFPTWLAGELMLDATCTLLESPFCSRASGAMQVGGILIPTLSTEKSSGHTEHIPAALKLWASCSIC